MHYRQQICHRDLKPDNLLIDSNYDLKIADFGFATHTAGPHKTNLHFTCKGTLGYMAPEILNLTLCEHRGYNSEQADTFALGVILFSMLLGRPPFCKADPFEDKYFKLLFTHQSHYFWYIWETEYAQKVGITLSPSFKALFTSLVAAEPALRPTLNELK